MSEAEKRRRAEYTRKRKACIVLQWVVLTLLLMGMVFSAAVYFKMDQHYYISYTEAGQADWRVYPVENNGTYEDAYLDADSPIDGFLTGLIDRVENTFVYELDMDTKGVKYSVSTWVDATVSVTDKEYGTVQSVSDHLVPQGATVRESDGEPLRLEVPVTVDYQSYARYAYAFLDTYCEGRSASADLSVTLYVDVTGVGDGFAQGTPNRYSVSMVMPLAETVTRVTTAVSVPAGQSRILTSDMDLTRVQYGRAALVYGGMAAFVGLVLLAFVLVTRDRNINYAIQVHKILSAYKSYIQRIRTPMDTASYEVLEVDSFREMLEIRDTTSSPVLMYENEDRTRCEFYIPTDSRLLYCFAIQVEGYDELYGTAAEETSATEVAEETPVTEAAEETSAPETADGAEPEEAAAEEMPDGEEPEEEEDAEETAPETATEEDSEEQTTAEEAEGKVRYDYSFEARLAMADEETKAYYTQLVTYARSWGVKVTRNWKKEKIHTGRTVYAAMMFRGARLAVAFALDPKEFEGSKYRAKDLSESKRHSKTPMLLKITSARRAKHALELLRLALEKAGVENKNQSVEIEAIPTREREELVAAGLIKTDN